MKRFVVMLTSFLSSSLIFRGQNYENLIAELLVKLAEKEEESKELVAQVGALEIVVTALMRRMDQAEQQVLAASIKGALNDASPKTSTPEQGADLLRQYIEKLLVRPQG